MVWERYFHHCQEGCAVPRAEATDCYPRPAIDVPMPLINSTRRWAVDAATCNTSPPEPEVNVEIEALAMGIGTTRSSFAREH